MINSLGVIYELLFLSW